MVTLRRKWKQSLKKGSSPDCCLAWCGTIYFVRWLHDVTSQIIAVRTSGLPARPQHVQLYMHISPTVGQRLPAHLTVQANVYTVSLHICLFACLQLKATVLNLIAITESPAAFISPLITFNNSIKQTQSCEDGRRSDSPKFCSVSMEKEGSPYFHVVFRDKLQYHPPVYPMANTSPTSPVSYLSYGQYIPRQFCPFSSL
jgi:hypothetical protein